MTRTSYVSTARLIQRRDAWLKEPGELGPMTRGSLVSARRRMRVERLAETFAENLAMLSGQHDVDTVACYIAQLILHGTLISSLRKPFGSAKNFARRLAESRRHHPAPADLPMPGQIRFQPP